MSRNSKKKRDLKKHKVPKNQHEHNPVLTDMNIKIDHMMFKPGDFGIENGIKAFKNICEKDPDLAISRAKVFNIEAIENQVLSITKENSEQLLHGMKLGLSKRINYNPRKHQAFVYRIRGQHLEFIIPDKQGSRHNDVELPIYCEAEDDLQCHILDMGFPTYDNCLFIGKDIIIHTVHQWDASGFKWWECDSWYPAGRYKHSICGVQELPTSISFNPLNCSSGIALTDIYQSRERHLKRSIPFRASMLMWSLMNNRPELKYVQPKRRNAPKYREFSDDHNNIIIDIAHKKLTRGRVQEPLSGIKKKYHLVRSHLRRLKNGKVITIKAHYRGDESLGIVEKDYTVIDTGNVI